MKTSIIHIVGVSGVGKTTLALDIVAGLERRGKTGVALMKPPFGPPIENPSAADLEYIRAQGLREPYGSNRKTFDVIIAEHDQHSPKLELCKGDLVIHIERAL